MLRQGIARGAWLITVAPGVLSAGAIAAGLGGGGVGAEAPRAGARIEAESPRRAEAHVHCSAPQTLRLRRFEDGSAQLLCAHRMIVRVHVPG